MRVLLWGFAALVALYVASIPLTGGVTFFLLPALPLLALYHFGLLVALFIAAKLIQRAAGWRDSMTLTALVLGLFVASLTAAFVWQWIDSRNCSATVARLKGSGRADHWRTHVVDFAGKPLDPEATAINALISGGAQKNIEAGRDSRGIGYSRVISNTVGIGNSHPLRAQGPKRPGCDYLMELPGLSISLDVATKSGTSSISSKPMCVSAAELAALRETKVEVYESDPGVPQRVKIARVSSEPSARAITLSLHRPSWYAFPLDFIVPRTCLSLGVRYHPARAFGLLRPPDLPPVNVLAAAAALRSIVEKR